MSADADIWDGDAETFALFSRSSRLARNKHLTFARRPFGGTCQLHFYGPYDVTCLLIRSAAGRLSLLLPAANFLRKKEHMISIVIRCRLLEYSRGFPAPQIAKRALKICRDKSGGPEISRHAAKLPVPSKKQKGQNQHFWFFIVLRCDVYMILLSYCVDTPSRRCTMSNRAP